jgi:tRNA-dihydrouridine synthase
MAEVTDLPFRSVVAKCGRPDVFYNEFVSAHGLCSPGRERLLKDLELGPDDHPIVAQFFGTEPEHFYECGKLAVQIGYDGVDVNMGCPDKKVLKQGAGIALAKDPARAQELVQALRQGTIDAGKQLPVAVKTRLGLYKKEEMDAWVAALLESEPDVLILHGRTMKEASKVPAHWDLIGRAAQTARDAGVLFVGNGDVMSYDRGVELARQWDVPGVMVGRGIFNNPWLFDPSVDPGAVTPHDRLALALEHTELWVRHWEGLKSFDLMKKFYKAYINSWPGAASLRAKLMACPDAQSARQILTEALN